MEMLNIPTRKSTSERSRIIKDEIYLLESRLSLQIRNLEKLNTRPTSSLEDRNGTLIEVRDIERQINLTCREITRLEKSLLRPGPITMPTRLGKSLLRPSVTMPAAG